MVIVIAKMLAGMMETNYFPHLYRMSQPRIRRRKTPASARGQLNRWVTVYGFDLELASDVFSIFEGFGDIVDHRVSSSNSIDLLFSTWAQKMVFWLFSGREHAAIFRRK